MFSAPITISIMDATLITAFISTHSAAPVPPAPAPTGTWPHLEPVATQFWPPGMPFGKHKMSKTVTHRGQCISLEGHDCGNFIPHVTVGPPSALLVLKIMGSSRKMNFSASSVKMNKKAAATGSIYPFFPMSTCAEPLTMPFVFSLASMPLSTVKVGLSGADALLGALDIVANMIIEIIAEGGLSKTFDKYKKAPSIFNRSTWSGTLRPSNPLSNFSNKFLADTSDWIFNDNGMDGRKLLKDFVDLTPDGVQKALKKTFGKFVYDNMVRNLVATFDGDPNTKMKGKINYTFGGVVGPNVEAATDGSKVEVGVKSKMSPNVGGGAGYKSSTDEEMSIWGGLL